MNNIQIKNFQKKIELDLLSGCWIWLACRDKKGYGLFRYNNKSSLAHRVAYEHWNGIIPKDLQIDHLCRTRHCVNPQHMELVTTQENTKRGLVGEYYRNKTHCPKKHEYTPENTYHYPDGRRDCIICKRTGVRIYRMRKQIDR